MKLWDAEKGQGILLALKRPALPVSSVALSPNVRRLFAWDAQKKVLAWSTEDGKPVASVDPYPMPSRGSTVRPDGTLRAEPPGNIVAVTHPRRIANDNAWPLPDLAERNRCQTEQITLAEKQ